MSQLWNHFVSDLCIELNNVRCADLREFIGQGGSESNIRRARAFFFADDLAVYCEDKEQLDRSWTLIDSWAQRNYIDINKAKSGVLEIRVD